MSKDLAVAWSVPLRARFLFEDGRSDWHEVPIPLVDWLHDEETGDHFVLAQLFPEATYIQARTFKDLGRRGAPFLYASGQPPEGAHVESEG